MRHLSPHSHPQQQPSQAQEADSPQHRGRPDGSCQGRQEQHGARRAEVHARGGQRHSPRALVGRDPLHPSAGAQDTHFELSRSLAKPAACIQRGQQSTSVHAIQYIYASPHGPCRIVSRRQQAEIQAVTGTAARRQPWCTWDRTVWMEGIMRPWATPTRTRATTMAAVRWASAGVSREAVDHSAKEMPSVRWPPHF